MILKLELLRQLVCLRVDDFRLGLVVCLLADADDFEVEDEDEDEAVLAAAADD